MTPQSPRSPAPRACSTSGIPNPGPRKDFTRDRMACNSPVFGVTDPENAIRNAVTRALEMLNNTLQELVNARTAICAGAPPAWPTLGDATARWLKYCLSVAIDDVRAWTAGTFVNRSVAEVIRRLIRVRNLVASNDIRYVCTGGSCGNCDPGDWAFVCFPRTGNPQTIVHLCKCFWLPGDKYGGRTGEKFDAATQAEFQAQTIVHEASHLTHGTADAPGKTIGGAECLAQFVAVSNNSPIHPCFIKFCPCSGAPWMPGTDELAKMIAFCNQHVECNPPALARREQPRRNSGASVLAEMDQPPINLGEADEFLKAGAEIRRQLNRNFRADDEAGYLDRRQKLRLAFRSVPDSFAEFLFEQLTDKKDPLTKMFRYKLHDATVNEMLGILFEKVKRSSPTT